MNQDNIILIEAGSPDFERLKQAIAYAEETGSYIRFYAERAESVPVFEKGDRVRAQADTGVISAEIAASGVDPEYGTVKISYGPGGKHHANVSQHSITTDHYREIPAVLKFKAYEGEWVAGIESHRPKGGY